MTSIFQRVIGSDFDRLHPMVRRRFSVGLDSGEACVGRGRMDRIWHGKAFVRPFLALCATRNILIPDTGRDIPFTIENFPYLDASGREAVTFNRTFSFPWRRPRRFDATMIATADGDRVVDYLGTHQHLATDLDFRVDDGALVIRSGTHRFREGPVDLRVPELIGGEAEVRESYDDQMGRFRIRVRVANRRFGPLFGYQGSFTARYLPVSGPDLPARLRPKREEARV